MSSQEFPIRLIRLRRERGVTQVDMADYLKVNKSLVAHWEAGRCKPGFDLLVKIAVQLRCSLDLLMCGIGDTAAGDPPPEPETALRYGAPLPAKESGCPIAFGIAVPLRGMLAAP